MMTRSKWFTTRSGSEQGIRICDLAVVIKFFLQQSYFIEKFIFRKSVHWSNEKITIAYTYEFVIICLFLFFNSRCFFCVIDAFYRGL